MNKWFVFSGILAAIFLLSLFVSRALWTTAPASTATSAAMVPEETYAPALTATPVFVVSTATPRLTATSVPTRTPTQLPTLERTRLSPPAPTRTPDAITIFKELEPTISAQQTQLFVQQEQIATQQAQVATLEKLKVTIDTQQEQIAMQQAEVATLQFGAAVSTQSARQNQQPAQTLAQSSSSSSSDETVDWLAVAAVLTPVVTLVGTVSTFYLGLRQQRREETKGKEED